MPLLASAVSSALSGFGTKGQFLAPDAWQGAYLGILEALERFDVSRGTNFGAYASKHVRGGVRRAIAGLVDFQTVVPDDSWDIEDQQCEISGVLEREDSTSVGRFVSRLPRRQRNAMELIYWGELSQAEAARILGVTRAAVNALHTKALERARSAPELAGILD